MERYAIIVAGGIGNRMNTTIPKQFIEIHDKPILMHTIEKFDMCDTIILVLPDDQIPFWNELCLKKEFNIKHQIVGGGKTRFQSVKNGISHIKNFENSLVAIHDGVRPLVSKSIIENTFKIASEKSNAVVCVPLKNSIRKVVGNISHHVDRSEYREIQTPQTFQSQLIIKAYQVNELPIFTDDASVLEHAGHTINLIEGAYNNIKITTPEDLKVAEIYL